MGVTAPVAVLGEEALDDLVEHPEVGEQVEHGVAIADGLGLDVRLAEARHVDADHLRVVRGADLLQAVDGLVRGDELVLHSRGDAGPGLADGGDAGTQFVALEVLLDGVLDGLVGDARDKEAADLRLDLLVGLRGRDDRVNVEGIHVDLEGLLPDRAGGDGADADLHAVRERRLPVEAVALHLPHVGELVAGARGRARRLGGLHREAGHDVALRESGDGLGVARADALGIGEGAAERALDERPHVVVDRFDAELVGEYPVGARGDLLDEIAVAGGDEALGSRGDDAQIGDESGRRRAGTGDLEAVFRDRRAEGGVTVDRGRGADVHILAAELARGELRDVVERARGYRADNRVLEGADVLAELLDVLVARVEGRGAGEDVGFLREFDPRGLQGGDDRLAGCGEGVAVGDDEDPRSGEHAGEELARLVKDVRAEDDVLRLGGRLQRLFDEFLRHFFFTPCRSREVIDHLMREVLHLRVGLHVLLEVELVLLVNVGAGFDARSLADHVAGRVLDRLVLARADGGEHARTEDYGVPDLGERDGQARDVGVHLHPVARLRGTAAGDELGRLEARVLEGLEDVRGAVADGLLDRVVDLLGRRAEGEAPHDAAGLGVGVRGAVALEVLVDDEPIGADRDVGDSLVEDLVGVHAEALGRAREVAAEVVLEPLEHGSGGDETSLARVLAGDDAVGVSAEEALAVERVAGLARDDVRGAGDDGGLAGRDDTEADLAGPRVGAALGDRSAGEEAELLGGGDREATDRVAEIVDLLGDLLEDVAAADVLVELDRPAALIAVVVHAQGRGVDVERPLAGELVGEPLGRVDEAVGVLVGLRLILLEPRGLEGVPLGGRGHRAAAVVEARPVIDRFGAGGLLGRADVHPHDRVAQLTAVPIHGDDGHRRRVVGDAGDVASGDAGLVEDLAGRGDEGVPPVGGALLGLAGAGVVGLVGGRREGDRVSGEVEDRGSARLRTVVESHDERAFVSGCNHFLVSFLSAAALRLGCCWSGALGALRRWGRFPRSSRSRPRVPSG